MTARKPTPCVHRDPLEYANRPPERGWDPYQAVYEHIKKLNASLKGKAA